MGAVNLASDDDLFEFRALAEAVNYRATLLREFGPALRGRVLEAGAGIGQLTRELLQAPAVTSVTAVEPNTRFVKELQTIQSPSAELRVVEGVAQQLAGSTFDAVISVNVLEHIEADATELRTYADLLRPRSGRLCLFVPARPELYAPIDKDFGHFRRYTKGELRAKLVNADFAVERLVYFNAIGYLAWWFTFKLRGQRKMDAGQVRLFDRWIFPAANACERIIRPPIGQSLLAIARAK